MGAGDICTTQMGTPWPLAYGYFRATGMRKIDYTIPAQIANPQPADTQIGVWDLGEGELDGINALWINDVLQFAYDSNGNLMGNTLLGVIPGSSNDPGGYNDTVANTPTLNAFSFHTGCDAPIGGSAGTSSTLQLLDPIALSTGGLTTPLYW